MLKTKVARSSNRSTSMLGLFAVLSSQIFSVNASTSLRSNGGDWRLQLSTVSMNRFWSGGRMQKFPLKG